MGEPIVTVDWNGATSGPPAAETVNEPGWIVPAGSAAWYCVSPRTCPDCTCGKPKPGSSSSLNAVPPWRGTDGACTEAKPGPETVTSPAPRLRYPGTGHELPKYV